MLWGIQCLAYVFLSSVYLRPLRVSDIFLLCFSDLGFPLLDLLFCKALSFGFFQTGTIPFLFIESFCLVSSEAFLPLCDKDILCLVSTEWLCPFIPVGGSPARSAL